MADILWCVLTLLRLCENTFLFKFFQCCGSGSTWIRNFCLDPELGKFKAGSVSGINNFGSTTLVSPVTVKDCVESVSNGEHGAVTKLLPEKSYKSYCWLWAVFRIRIRFIRNRIQSKTWIRIQFRFQPVSLPAMKFKIIFLLQLLNC